MQPHVSGKLNVKHDYSELLSEIMEFPVFYIETRGFFHRIFKKNTWPLKTHSQKGKDLTLRHQLRWSLQNFKILYY